MFRSDSIAALRTDDLSGRVRARKHLVPGKKMQRVARLMVVGCCACTFSAAAQLLPGAGSSQGTTDSGTDRDSSGLATGQQGASVSGRDDLARNGSVQPGAALSADQITTILEQNPELASELKLQIADRLRQQGVDAAAGDVSDDMLYRQIASSADLRASITTVLAARGYVSNDDLISSGLAGNGQVDQGSQQAPASDQGTGSGSGALAATSGSASQRGRELNFSTDEGVRRDAGHASTDEPVVVHATTPYDLPSARDLYTQIPERSEALKRFGSDVFVHRRLSAMARGVGARDAALDVPIGPDYVLGAGDKLTIHLWGGTTQTISRMVDRDGTLFLPEAGSLQIAGLTLGKAQTLIEGALKRQFRDAQVSVVVSELRSVRVYVVGDVQRPGGYDLSALATPISVLYAAGGPTAAGSLRTLKHYRGDRLVEDVDLYDFLLRGIRSTVARFESGDSLLVPPAGTLVAVSGAVRRPAIYELKAGETSLKKVIDRCGGLTAAASLSNMVVERIDENHSGRRSRYAMRPTEGKPGTSSPPDLNCKDGDKVKVDPILALQQAGRVSRWTCCSAGASGLRRRDAAQRRASRATRRFCRSLHRMERSFASCRRIFTRRRSISTCLTC